MSKKRSEPDEHRNDGWQGKYFHVMLNMADDDLGPFEYRLLGHYIRVCGAESDGICFQSVRNIAQATQMSIPKVIEARKTLQAAGWIRVVEQSNKSHRITVVDRMEENIKRYVDQKTERNDLQANGDQYIEHDDQNIDRGDQYPAYEEQPIKNNPSETTRKDSAPVGADTTTSHSQEPDATPNAAAVPEPDADPPAPAAAPDVPEMSPSLARLFPSDAPKQPHVAIIDAYHQALIDLGREPMIDNWYSRYGRAAKPLVKAGVDPADVYRATQNVYANDFTDAFFRKRAAPITLEELAAGWAAAESHRKPPPPRPPLVITSEEIDREQDERLERLRTEVAAGKHDDRLKDVA
jgi:hypothetical protein